MWLAKNLIIKMEQQKYILLTGAFGGLGIALLDLLIANNYHIFACDIISKVPDNYKQHAQITPISVDVQEQASIDQAFNQVSNVTTKLDAIVHTAGILEVGSMVEIPTEKIQHILDINFLGVYRINKTFLQLILNSKGRILILSSETGKQTAAPFNGAYALSKYALEAYSDALRRELSFYGIKVIKFQPGAFKTNMTKRVEEVFLKAENNSKLFKQPISKGSSYLPNVYKKANDPILLAKIMMKALTVINPKTTYAVKQDSQRNFLEFLPVKWADKLIKKVLS